MVFMKEEQVLTNENIDFLTEEITEKYAASAGKRVGNKVAFSLEIQELLLRFQELYGTDTPCRITGQKRMGKITFTIQQKGPQRDPVMREDEMSYSYDILASLGAKPKYSYSPRNGGVNTVTVTGEQKPKKNVMLRNIIIAIFLAVLFSIALKNMPQNISSVMTESFVSPFFTKLITLLTELATPFVFFAVVTGITGIGNQATVGKIGKKLLSGMMGTYMFAGVVFSALAVIVYPLSVEGGESGGFITQMVQLVLDIVPDNILQAFSADNDLQVIFFAIFTGVVMLVLGEHSKMVNHFCTECADIFARMMAIVCKFLPAIVFLGVVNLCSSDLSQILSMYKMVLLFIAGAVILLVYMLLRTKINTKVPLRMLFKKQLATLMINLTTSSQVSALPENMKCCKKKFGINEKMVDFGLPLGIVVYMPCGAMFLGLVTWSLANLSGTPISAAEVIKICFVAIIVAIAAPPIPGSACAVMPIIFSSCGIPKEVYPLGIIMATFIGYLLPAINGYCLQLELLISARKLGLVDTDKLSKPYVEE
ncbi:MAG: cation:dicarboxylase symporter family transporter [Eubacterium sp.]|nr:cation:dicarboxylase symporter family transporter [Eubacterium sp.]